MPKKPIFVATHPRACSTAFERVFMTRTDVLQCVHEPFGDAFYFGPERLSERYENDEAARKASGFEKSTFKTIFDRLERESSEGKRLFIKDITHYLVPPKGKPASIAPSLGGRTIKKGVGTDSMVNGADGAREVNGHNATNDHANSASNAPYPYDTEAEEGNPTVVPKEILKQFHFTFLIRHPRRSIPSYYRCTIPPLDTITGFPNFMPSEAGYDELRRFFDFLRTTSQVGPAIAGQNEAARIGQGEVSITVVDADDLLDKPYEMIEAYCKEVGLDYQPSMLEWNSDEEQRAAKEAFEKWRGFHDDAIDSERLKPRDPSHKKKTKTAEVEDEEWKKLYGADGARVIREAVEANVQDYDYLKSFAIKV